MNKPLLLAASTALLIPALLAAPGCAAIDGPGMDPALRRVTQRVFPAVVRVDARQRKFAGGKEESVGGVGSGVIISSDGHILTNFHVAGRATRIDVTLHNKERIRARLVGADHWTDIAVLQLDPNDLKNKGIHLTVAQLGDSATLRTGQPVVAMGTPHGLARTMTHGIVSNTERYFAGFANIGGYETGYFNTWIQTDAAINPGNSGGPLVDMNAKVVGINTLANLAANNLGFAVPINVAKQVVQKILDHGAVERSYIGLKLSPLQDLETYYELPIHEGALVRSVDNPSPASAAGLKAEDVLLAIDDQPANARFPEELPALRKRIADLPIGTTVALKVKRGDRTLVFNVKTQPLESAVSEQEEEFPAWGLTAREITRAYARKAALEDTDGVLVTGVKSDFPADRAQVQAGDILRRVNDEPVKDLPGLRQLIQMHTEKKTARILLEIKRGRSTRLTVLKLDKD